MHHIADPFPHAPRGHFRMWAWRHGILVAEDDDPNVIVDLAKEQMARLIGGDVTNRSVTQIGIGTGTGAALPSNTSLTNSFVRAVTGVTYPNTNQVRFSWTIDANEGNGRAVTEFGLFTAGSILFARRVRSGAIQKESDLTLTGTWTITF